MQQSIKLNVFEFRGANARFMLFVAVAFLPIAIIGLALCALVFFSATGHLAQWSSGLGLIVFSILPVVFFYANWQAKSAVTAIDRSAGIVTTKAGTFARTYALGNLESLLIQPVTSPQGAPTQYCLYLVGASGKSPLGLMALTVAGVEEKARSLMEFLSVPINIATDSIGLDQLNKDKFG
jgi:hypothetical protein